MELLEPHTEFEETVDIKRIKIQICGYGHVVPIFPSGDLLVQASFLNQDLGISDKTPAAHEDFLPTSHDFYIEVNTLSVQDMNELISNPVVFTVFECPSADSGGSVTSIQDVPKTMLESNKLSLEEAIELQRLYTGKSLQIDKPACTSKESVRSSVVSKESKESKKSVLKTPSIISYQPQSIGVCTLDLLPLFTGYKKFKDYLPVHPAEKYLDDRMIPEALYPYLSIQVSLEEDVDFLNQYCNHNLLNVTVESIYHIPDSVIEDFRYKICCYVPEAPSRWNTIVFPEGTSRKEKPNQVTEFIKWWPCKLKNSSCLTWAMTEEIKTCWNDIVHNSEADLKDLFHTNTKRIEWNTLYRCFLNEEANTEFINQIQKYRHIFFEIKIQDQKINGSSWHLMAFADVSTLLNPGQKICRVICPIYTYLPEDVLKYTGMNINKCEDVKECASEKATTITSKTKSDQKKDVGKGAAKINLLSNVVEPVEEEKKEASPFLDENGKQAFVVVEIELFNVINPSRPIENLSNKLDTLIPKYPQLNKVVLSSTLADAYFQQVIEELLNDLGKQYESFRKGSKNIQCDEDKNKFVSFIQDSESYQIYINSLIKALTMIADNKFVLKNDEDNNIFEKIFRYTYKTVNNFCDKSINSDKEKNDKLLFYAKEACEIGADILADRYYLQRICEDENANSWLDYSIFLLEINNKEKAFECVRESLFLHVDHGYSLLLFGILLTEKNKLMEAEVCFLNAIYKHANWMEAWGIFYMFYRQFGKFTKAEFCLEQAKKYLNQDPPEDLNYYTISEDLIWVDSTCPPKVFYKTASFLIKIRALNFAERALAYESDRSEGIFYYYLGIISYYRHNFKDALDYLLQARKEYGDNYAILSLIGHCYVKLEKSLQAQEIYSDVLKLYSRPEDLHMLYVYFALQLEKSGNTQSSRKFLLKACKLSPTPYTWLGAGLLYYQQQDFLSAEECLVQATVLDNRLPEIWAYLHVIYLKLDRTEEAEWCWKQTLKENASEELVQLIENIKMHLEK